MIAHGDAQRSNACSDGTHPPSECRVLSNGTEPDLTHCATSASSLPSKTQAGKNTFTENCRKLATGLPCNSSHRSYASFVSILGFTIYRFCTRVTNVTHECDVKRASDDIDATASTYCFLSCQGNGCNRQTLEYILPRGNGVFHRQHPMVMLCSVHLLVYLLFI